jgi:hypothetical protein
LKHEVTVDDTRTSLKAVALIIGACFAIFLFFGQRSLVPDIGWLIEASRRFVSGERLYVDIIEVNPPLIIYESVLLSAGQLTPATYIAGVCAIMAVSTLWVLRLRGPELARYSLLAMLIGGFTDFGQRDHLVTIYLIPFLLAERASKPERVALGLWAFLGVGLKPYFLLIPAAAVAGRAFATRSIRPFFAVECLALGAAGVAYVGFVAVVHPEYFDYIIPLGRFVYWTYGAELSWPLAALSVAVGGVGLVPFLTREKALIPLGAAVLGGLASFYLQGRNWSYHLIPAAGLALLLALLIGRRLRAANTGVAIIAALQLVRGAHPGSGQHVIPPNVRSVAFLVSHVFGAYPETLECNVRNATRYPAIWVVPGAWNIAHDPSRTPADRARALALLRQEKATILKDIGTYRPEIIYADARRVKPYYKYPFDYVQFLGGLSGYRKTGRVLNYEVWMRNDLPARKIVAAKANQC